MTYDMAFKMCVDINECVADSNPCGENEVCRNTIGGYVCECEYGLHKQDDQCVDVNECATGIDECSHICENTYGSYKCHCPINYKLDNNGHSCKVIEPVEVQCPHGFFSEHGKCTDVNECDLGEDDCTEDQACLNTKGSYLCIPLSCPSNFVLNEENG
jgi:hypothetical protein